MARTSKIVQDIEKKEILNRLKTNAKKANLRLALLKRYYGKKSWSSRILEKTLKSSKIQGFSNNKIKYDDTMTLSQLRAIDKATKNFLNARTSKYSGIKEIRKETIQSFRKRFGDESEFDFEKLSNEDAEKLYSIFESRNSRKFAEKVGGSSVLQLLADNMKENATEEEFFKDVYANLIDEKSVDATTKKTLKSIYNKIIKK